MLLDEAKLVCAAKASARYEMRPVRLTMAGHEYLDAIRDEEVWRQTGQGANAVGSFSLEVLSGSARGLVREKVRQHTGIEIIL